MWIYSLPMLSQSWKKLMKIDNSQQIVVIEALRNYRDKLISMKIDAAAVVLLLKQFREERQREEEKDRGGQVEQAQE